MVTAYVYAWRGSGTVKKQDEENVIQAREKAVASSIHPWPTIEDKPTAFREDGKFAIAHPLCFPTGSGDFLQARFRSDFSIERYVRHVFRYFTGHMQSSLRGHRILWGIFNMSMQERAREKGGLVHQRSHAGEILTKQDLKDLVSQRNDLVHQMSTWGAQLPTTSMH